MKKLLLLCSILIYISLGASAQVYFNQDFNSSTAISTYKGRGPNQFDGIESVGNVTINANNNKLQVVKKSGSGNNRGGFTRSTAHPIGPAQFLKFSMDITMSENNAAIANGFQFTVGAIGAISPLAPPLAQIHSMMIVNPTDKAGEFTITIGKKTSQVFSGTQTLVWYINNTGAPVGYEDPEGNISSLPDDANTLWVVSGSSKVLAIDREPAENGGQVLRSFKLANNPSFDATLDIDNIVLSEEPVVIIPEIKSIATVPSVFEVPMRTSFSFLNLPKEIEVTYDNNQTGKAEVIWAPGPEKYNGYRSGDYVALGTLKPAKGTINPLGLKLQTIIRVKPDVKIVNTFTPDGDGKNDTWLIPDLQYYKKVNIEVFDRSGLRVFQSNDPKMGWDGKNQHGKAVGGSYFYVIQVQDISLTEKGVLTIVK